MDDFFTDRIKMQVLDFATDKRTVWEQNHQLYSVIFEISAINVPPFIANKEICSAAAILIINLLYC